VRFFRVMVAIGRCERGSSMGSTLSSKRSGPNLSMEPQATVRKRPVANRLFPHIERMAQNPCVRNLQPDRAEGPDDRKTFRANFHRLIWHRILDPSHRNPTKPRLGSGKAGRSNGIQIRAPLRSHLASGSIIPA
jgi:hypothetical protein